MSNPNPNRRPLPKKVYRRRQIGCLLVLAIIVGLVWGIVAAVKGMSSKASNPTSSNTAASTAGTGEPCALGSIAVKPVVTDQTLKDPRQSFGPHETPYFGFTLTNIGPVDCSFNLGSAQQFYSVTSGAETYWSSKNCDRSGTLDMVKVIKAGESLSSQPTPWQRVRSSATGCNIASGQAAVPAGGATFHLNVSVAGVLSEPGQGAFILR